MFIVKITLNGFLTVYLCYLYFPVTNFIFWNASLKNVGEKIDRPINIIICKRQHPLFITKEMKEILGWKNGIIYGIRNHKRMVLNGNSRWSFIFVVKMLTVSKTVILDIKFQFFLDYDTTGIKMLEWRCRNYNTRSI